MNELKQKRKKIGITQRQAAKACGVSRRTYQTYEERSTLNDTYRDLLKKLDEMGVLDGSNYISNVRYIKYACNQLFKEKYSEIKCAYLFGSYARGEATGESDIDILVVGDLSSAMFCEIVAELGKQLHKQIDLYTYRHLLESDKLLEEILIHGIKLFG